MNQRFKSIILTIVGLLVVWIYVSFNSYVLEDLVWFNNSDQNSWVIYSSLDFNDGEQSKYISHPGVSSSFVYGLGFRVMEALGIGVISKSSQLQGHKDPLALLPNLYKTGSTISMVLILICALLMGCVVFLICGELIYAAYAILLTLASCGFLFHSVMLRNELTSIFYFIFALFVFLLGYKQHNGTNLDTDYTNLKVTALYLTGGFLFGLSYFAKSQIVLTAVLFFVFLIFHHVRFGYKSNVSVRIYTVVLLGHLLSLTYLKIGFDIDIPIFWLLIYGFFSLLGLVSLATHRLVENSLVSFISIVNRFSLGFTAAIPYILVRGLKGETRAEAKVLMYTSFWNPGKTSIQAQTLDTDMSSILARFFYFLQSYFVESLLLVTLIYTLYLFIKGKKKWSSYGLAIGLIILGCYLNSMRSNLTANLGRSIFKYIIYIDVAAIILVVCTYVDSVKIGSINKVHVHLFFWTLLLGISFNNSRKVASITNWDWTTYADLVYPERWLLPGSPPKARRILKDKYKGFANGHDRIIFGNEMPRHGIIEVPGGERHLQRVQRLSVEPYLNRMGKLFGLDSIGFQEVKKLEARLLNIKIKAFIEGDDYHAILEKATKKRKFLYKKFLDQPSYIRYVRMLEEGKLSVPF